MPRTTPLPNGLTVIPEHPETTTAPVAPAQPPAQPLAQSVPLRRRFHRRHYRTLDELFRTAAHDAGHNSQQGLSTERELVYLAGEITTAARGVDQPPSSRARIREAFGRFGLLRYSRPPRSEEALRATPEQNEVMAEFPVNNTGLFSDDVAGLSEQRNTFDEYRRRNRDLEEYRGEITHVMGFPLENITGYTLILAKEDEDGSISEGVMQRVYRSTTDPGRLEGYNTRWSSDDSTFSPSVP